MKQIKPRYTENEREEQKDIDMVADAAEKSIRANLQHRGYAGTDDEVLTVTNHITWFLELKLWLGE